MALLRAFPNLVGNTGRVKPTGIPRIDWNHPLAQGLEAYWFDTGLGAIVNLVNGQQMTIGGTAIPVRTTPYGSGFLYAGATRFTTPSTARIQAVSAAGPYTFGAGFMPTTATPGTNTIAAGRAGSNVGPSGACNWGFYYNGTLWRGIFHSSGTSTTSEGSTLTGALAANKYVGMSTAIPVGGTLSSFTYTQGFQDDTDVGPVLGSNNVSDNVIFGGASSAGNVDPYTGYVFWLGFWTRQLTPSENFQLYQDPYCFLLPQEGIMPVMGGLLNAYTLPASPGSYTITGASASLLEGHILNASPGSYTITGASASLLEGHIIKASPGAYTISGDTAALLEGHILNATPGAYSITGATASLLWDHVLGAAGGAYTINGASAALLQSGQLVLAALPGSYTITGTSAGLVYVPAGTVKPDIDSVLTKKQLHALRARLAREREQRGHNLEEEGRSRAELRTTLESFFKVAEPEHIEEIKEKLPVVAETRTEIGARAPKSSEFHAHIDWPKLYDDRALMEGLTRDLSKILTDHLERQRFEQEEDDLAILMMA